MENIKNLVHNKNLKTRFLTPLEIKNYLSILGANIIDDNNFVLDGLNCGIDRKYEGICFNSEFSCSILSLFEKYGMKDSIYENIIFDLEGLVLLHMILCGKNIEEDYNKVLNHVKREMLFCVLTEKEKIKLNSPFSKFDQAITPFLNDNFDSNEFLEQCVFNTTGYYEKDGYDKCLKFQWRAKKDPDTLYAIQIHKDGFWDTIMHKDNYKRFHQQLYHFYSDKADKISFFYGDNIQIDFDVKNNQIEEYIDTKEITKKANEFDALIMSTIARSFQDDELLFEKRNSKKKTLQLDI